MNFSKLIDEDKHIIKKFVYDDGTILMGNIISRIFEKENGKVCFIISKESKSPDSKEDIVYFADDLNDKKHAEALMIINKNIYLRPSTLTGKYYYHFLSFLENILPSKITLFVIIVIILGFYFF